MSTSKYALQFISLFYICLIGIVFKTKKTKANTGSKIFSQLIFCVFLSIIFDIFCVFTKTNNYIILNNVFDIAFLLSIVRFIVIFTEYISIVVSEEKQEEKRIKYYNKIHKFFSIAYIIWSIILIVFSNQLFNPTQTINMIFLYIFCGISWAFCLSYWIVIMSRFIIRNIGEEVEISKIIKIIWHTCLKNLLPIAVSVVPGTIALIIQFYNPDFHIIVPVFTFSVINMYFTIFPSESPDLELAEEMEKAKNESEKANISKTEFLSTVSHEIRTPINAILGFSQSLLQQNISDNVREEVEYIVLSSEELLETVNEILDISKIESNKFELLNIDYSPNKIYNSLVLMTIAKLENKDLQFIHNYNKDIPPVLYGDYIRINQVITNLLNNAIKYTESGFIKLKFDYEIITEGICRLVITVSDSGVGIDEDNLENIFSKFKGMEVQKNIKIQGTGLGLSLTKKLVNILGGKINVQSVKNEGSTFNFYVDQVISDKNLEELEINKNEEVTNGFIGNGQKILIVDDNGVNIKVALRLMKDYNLEIDTLTSGKECLDRIHSGKEYDLIMLDDMMPDMGGVETLANLKKISGFNTKTVALTANSTSGIREEYISKGFDDYLAKPIDKNLLEDLFIRLLGNTVVDKKIELKQIEQEKEKSDDRELNKVEYLIKNNIDVDKALESLGDMEMYNETLIDFLNEVEEKINNLEKFKNQKDMPNYSIIIHSLKSDLKYLGILDLADLAYKHEVASKSNDVNYIISTYDELIKQLNNKLEVLRKYIN